MSKEIDVTDLPESQLKKSSTYLKYHGEFGTCLKCKEMTNVLYPCCDSNTFFEGAIESSDNLWTLIEEELGQSAEAQAYNQEDDQ